MDSTTWLSELPSCAAAWCAAARRPWSILIVRCGRSPFALASRRCGNGGGASRFVTRPRSSAGTRRRTRRCTACLLMPSASASGRSGQPASLSAASVADSRSLRPDERSSRSRAAIRSGNTGLGEAEGSGTAGACRARCTYWRRPCVTTSDMVRPSRARRALRRRRCSWSRRNVSSRLFAAIHTHPAAATPASTASAEAPTAEAPAAEAPAAEAPSADAPPAGVVCSAATSSR
jgi:hypothetical protein